MRGLKWKDQKLLIESQFQSFFTLVVQIETFDISQPW